MGRGTASAIFAMGCTICTVSLSITAFSLAIVLRLRLERLQANSIGDPEKEFMDECLRDFEGLAADDPQYLSNQNKCLKKLMNERLNLLPVVRPTVDERICDPTNLCSDGDPGQCEDEGEIGGNFFKPGDVRQCYDLVDATKAARVQKEYFRLLDEVESRCTNPRAWSDYKNRVHLRYCMWKHLSSGICTNNARTNCPRDGSCCPYAQQTRDYRRPDRYTCRKSPTVGLYCELLADGNATGSNISTGTSLCEEADCPWCLDLADIPGLCLGPVCKQYQRTLDYAAAVAAFMGIAIILDLGELGLRLCSPAMAPEKWILVHAGGASMKLLGVMLCSASGVLDLLETALTKNCLEGDDDPTQSALWIVWVLIFTMIATGCGSCGLAPLTAMRETHAGLPYAKVVPRGS